MNELIFQCYNCDTKHAVRNNAAWDDCFRDVLLNGVTPLRCLRCHGTAFRLVKVKPV